MLTEDRIHMARALQLARRGQYSTRPNPRVGCVLVRQGKVVGEGWHQLAGGPHAEIEALAVAGTEAAGATAYVTLEPCSHQGRTGPCCEALARAGVSRVVAAMRDPNPRVSGSGFQRLRAQGIAVESGLLEAEARALNPGFIRRHSVSLPWVRCKLAMSLDGRTALADGRSNWITGPEARADVQRLRAGSCAVVTGVGTVLADDPRLNLRQEELRIAEPALALRSPPARVVLDSRLRTPATARLFEAPGPVLLLHGRNPGATGSDLQARGARLHALPERDGRLELTAVLKFLAAQEYNELLFECGATLAGSLLEAGLLDELIVYVSGRLLGDQGLPLVRLPPVGNMNETMQLNFAEVRMVGGDLRITLVPARPTIGQHTTGHEQEADT